MLFGESLPGEKTRKLVTLCVSFGDRLEGAGGSHIFGNQHQDVVRVCCRRNGQMRLRSNWGTMETIAQGSESSWDRCVGKRRQ